MFDIDKSIGKLLGNNNRKGKSRSNNFGSFSIKNDFFSKNNAKVIPHWILKQLKPYERVIAEDMLLNKGASHKDILARFPVPYRPFKGQIKKPKVFWSREQKLYALKDLANELGRTPNKTDFHKAYPLGPTRNAYRSLGGWNNALRMAGLEPVFILPERRTIENLKEANLKISKENVKTVGYEKYRKTPEVRKKQREYYEKSRMIPGVKEREKEYRGRKEVKARMKENQKGRFTSEKYKEYIKKPEIIERRRNNNKVFYMKKRYITSIGGKDVWNNLPEDQRNQLINKWKQEAGY